MEDDEQEIQAAAMQLVKLKKGKEMANLSGACEPLDLETTGDEKKVDETEGKSE